MLSWVTLPGRLPGSGCFPFEQLKQLHGCLPGSGRLPGTLRYMHGINWGTFNYASHATQLMSCNYFVGVYVSEGVGRGGEQSMAVYNNIK